MEVHHHTQTPRKKWTHYLWEFLMLFLAVTLGFFVENWREHYVENSRAKEYAKGLLEDFKNDTANLLFNRTVDINIMSWTDSLQLIVNRLGNNTDEVPGAFYYYSRRATTIGLIAWSRATLHQVIFSGSARYFKNQELMKKISGYYTTTEFVNSLRNFDNDYRRKCMELRSRVLKSNYYSIYAGILADSLKSTDSLMIKMYRLQDNDPELLNEYLNSFHNRTSVLKNLIREIDASREMAIGLIEMIKKEYHLE